MGLTADGNDAWTFDTDTRVYCFNDKDLAIYSRENDDAWLSCENAPHLTDYA